MDFNRNMEALLLSENNVILEPSGEVTPYTLLHEDDNELLYIKEETPLLLFKQSDPSFTTTLYKQELIIVFGMLAVGEIQHLMDTSHSGTIFLIIEPDETLFLTAMLNHDLYQLFNRPNVFAMTGSFDELKPYFESMFATRLAFLLEHTRFYLTDYYRRHEAKLILEIVRQMSDILKYLLFTYGNSIDDSLIGLRQNLVNFNHYARSRNIAEMRGKFANLPVVIVAAGPSLDKQIEWLKQYQERVIIFAVDTILQKLVANGIEPHFCFAIERGVEVYDYFFKRVTLPSRTKLVAPTVIYPKILNEYDGDLFLPLRDGVREFNWISDVLQLGREHFIPIGVSVAHLAFGFAKHTGASPIMFVGQDLAYNQETGFTHSTGTIYEEIDPFEADDCETMGYYGQPVKTQRMWLDFKHWFETQLPLHEGRVINCTEGGVRIEGTEQMPFKEALEQFAQESIEMDRLIKDVPLNQLTEKEIRQRLNKEISTLKKVRKFARELNHELHSIQLTEQSSPQSLEKALNRLKKGDELLHSLYNHELLFHCFQSYLLNLVGKFYGIEQKLTFESVQKNVHLQIDFSYTVEHVVTLIIQTIDSFLAGTLYDAEVLA